MFMPRVLIVCSLLFVLALASCQSSTTTPTARTEKKASSTPPTNPAAQSGEEKKPSVTTFTSKDGVKTTVIQAGTKIQDLPPEVQAAFKKAEEQAMEQGFVIDNPQFTDKKKPQSNPAPDKSATAGQ